MMVTVPVGIGAQSFTCTTWLAMDCEGFPVMQTINLLYGNKALHTWTFAIIPHSYIQSACISLKSRHEAILIYLGNN